MPRQPDEELEPLLLQNQCKRCRSVQRTVKKIFRPCLFKERKKTKSIFSYVPEGETRNRAGEGLICRTGLFKCCFVFIKQTKAKGKAGEACRLRNARRGEVEGFIINTWIA